MWDRAFVGETRNRLRPFEPDVLAPPPLARELLTASQHQLDLHCHSRLRAASAHVAAAKPIPPGGTPFAPSTHPPHRLLPLSKQSALRHEGPYLATHRHRA